MKIGMRKPSLKKSLKARTTGKLKRQIKRAVIPGYGQKGMGWIKNPKKAAYNKLYHKTTFGINDIVKVAGSSGTKSKQTSNKSYTTSSNRSYTAGNKNYSRKNQNKNGASNLRKNVIELEKKLGISTKAMDISNSCIAGGTIALLLGMAAAPLIIIGAILDVLGFLLMFKKSYWNSYRWDKAVQLYLKKNYSKSKVYLDKLPSKEKETPAYREMLNLLNGTLELITKEDKVDTAEHNAALNSEAGNNYKINNSHEVFDEFISIDTETTGLDSKNDKIVEISAVRYKNGSIIDKFETLINPQMHIPFYITDINNIDDEMVKGKPLIGDVMDSFLEFIGDFPLVAHNASFDINFINANLVTMDKIINNKVIDTLKISRKIYPDLINHKLVTIKQYLKLQLESHRSTADCMVAAEIYLDYCKIVNDEIAAEKSTELDLHQ